MLEAYFNSCANSQLIDSPGICIAVNISTANHQKLHIIRYYSWVNLFQMCFYLLFLTVQDSSYTKHKHYWNRWMLFVQSTFILKQTYALQSWLWEVVFLLVIFSFNWTPSRVTWCNPNWVPDSLRLVCEHVYRYFLSYHLKKNMFVGWLEKEINLGFGVKTEFGQMMRNSQWTKQ